MHLSSLPIGELKKTVEIVIRDDIEPEDNESLMIGLVNTEGGSRILPSSDTVTIVILANDNVAGIVGFHPSSRSVIAREGGWLFLKMIIQSMLRMSKHIITNIFYIPNTSHCPCHQRCVLIMYECKRKGMQSQ